MTNRPLFIVVAFTLLAGCTGETGEVGHIRLPGINGTEFRITLNGVSNERVSVTRVEQTHNFRGVIDGSMEIEMRTTAEDVEGDRNSLPIKLHLEPRQNGFTARGLYGGKLITVHVRHEPTRSCAFRYEEHDPSVVSSCGTEGQAIPIPRFLSALPEAEQAALIAVVFNR